MLLHNVLPKYFLADRDKHSSDAYAAPNESGQPIAETVWLLIQPKLSDGRLTRPIFEAEQPPLDIEAICEW